MNSKRIFRSDDLSCRGGRARTMLPSVLGRTTRRCAPILLKMGEQLQESRRKQANNSGDDNRHQRGFDRHPQLRGRRTASGGRVGNVETESGGRQVFAAVARADTNIVALIDRRLDAVGRAGDTELTGFTDGVRSTVHIGCRWGYCAADS